MTPVVPFAIVDASLFALLGAFLTFDNNARTKGFIWLGVFFFLMSANAIDAALQIGGIFHQYPFLMLWEDPSALLFGPVIYFFSENIISSKKWKNVYIIHLAPYFLALLAVAFFHVQADYETLLRVSSMLIEKQLFLPVIWAFIPLFTHMMIYLLLSMMRLRRHQNSLKQFYSNVTLSWTSHILQVLFVIFVVSFLSTIIRLSSSSYLQSGAILSVLIVSIVLISKVLLDALKQPVFHLQKVNTPTIEMEPTEVNKLVLRLNQQLSNEQLFQKADLTLKEVAKALNTSTRSLSFVINQELGKNFYDYINDFRIEAAKEILSKNPDPKLTILEVMYKVGYNSKSSFNTQFKKKTGLTPSAFRKQHNPT
ncbi:MAG: helix-turn-helix domain-containing protein [Cytophagales bacterium]|nr:helix-turn-helix domain-containing protein [Cytophagales bacterium]